MVALAVHDLLAVRPSRQGWLLGLALAIKLTPAIFVPFLWDGTECANRLSNPALDPVSGMPEFKVCAVRIEAAAAAEQGQAR